MRTHMQIVNANANVNMQVNVNVNVKHGATPKEKVLPHKVSLHKVLLEKKKVPPPTHPPQCAKSELLHDKSNAQIMARPDEMCVVYPR